MKINNTVIKFLTYLQYIYNIQYYFDKNWIYIVAGKNDIFRINVLDGARFGKYELFHRNSTANLDGIIYYHKQLNARSLCYALFAAGTHFFNKEINIMNTVEDYKKFYEDAMRYIK